MLTDPIIMTMAQYYQEPLCLDPLDCDPDKIGKKSDHRIPITKPINIINNKSARITRTIKNRPITLSGIKKMQDWLMEETWDNISQVEDTHEKAKVFQDTLLRKYEQIFQSQKPPRHEGFHGIGQSVYLLSISTNKEINGGTERHS